MVDAHPPFLTVDNVILSEWNVLLPITITIGRDDPAAQPDANTLSFGYIGEFLPSFIRRGAPVTVRKRWDPYDVWQDTWEDAWIGQRHFQVDAWFDTWDDIWAGQYTEAVGQTRFKGYVSDITAMPHPGADLVEAQVTCIGRLVDYQDIYLGDEPWPSETDAARATRIAGLLNSETLLFPDGSPVLRLMPRDVDRKKVLELLHESGGSVGSIVWEHPDGTVHYEKFDDRPTPTVLGAVHLPAAAIEADLEWAQSTDQLITAVEVEYGTAPEGGSRPSYKAGDGTRLARLTGEVADLASATIVGQVVLARWARTDLWDSPVLRTRSDLLDLPTYETVQGLLPSDPVHTAHMTLAPSSGTRGEGLWFIEGWTETYDRAGDGAPLSHQWEFAVSDVRRFIVTGASVDLLIDFPDTCEIDPHNMVEGRMYLADGGFLPTEGWYVLYSDEYQLDTFDVGMFQVPPFQREWWVWFTKARLLPGPNTLQMVYSGYPQTTRPAASNIETMTAINVGYSQCRLNTTTLHPHVGDRHTLTAQVYAHKDGPAQPEGELFIERWESGTGNAATDVYSVVAGPISVSGKEVFEYAYTYDVPASYEEYRAHFYPVEGDPQIGWNYSSDLHIQPLQREYLEAFYDPASIVVMDREGHTDFADLRQGDWGDGHDTAVLFTYDTGDRLWLNYVIERVEAYLYVTQVQGSMYGTVRLGTHQGTADTVAHRQDVHQWPANTGRWVDITPWGRRIAIGESHLAAGPADRDSLTTQVMFSGASGEFLPGERWDDLSGDVLWDTVPAETTWDTWNQPTPGVLAEPHVPQWNDTPWRIEWDDVPAETTWDEWKIPGVGPGLPPSLRIAGYTWVKITERV